MSDSQARGGANVEFRQVGRPLARIDAPGKSHGKTRYAGDYVMPGMLHVKVLRSPEASALLTRIDVSRAHVERMRGRFEIVLHDILVSCSH